MYTPEQIENLIKPFGLSLTTLPKADKTSIAYDISRHYAAIEGARNWGNKNDLLTSNMVMCDFICHQSDVIELLCSALEKANI